MVEQVLTEHLSEPSEAVLLGRLNISAAQIERLKRLAGDSGEVHSGEVPGIFSLKPNSLMC